MQLTAGTRVGRYRIESLLGSGGMGEVYRAHDSVLDRAVALKILHHELTTDATRIHRFTLEARSASSLTHPNILTIYDIGQETPVSGEAREEAEALHFISMELVAGETLRAGLSRDVDLETKLDWMIQIAEGLVKAHEAGIVHRDLKPENLMISADGYVKILDFGLAKLIEPVGQAADLPSDVATAMRTEEGKILGTAGYMSPEQVQGKSADQRSDIFSFGCVLYEAIAGRRAFAGTSRLDLLYQIVHTEPSPSGELQSAAPSELQRIVRKCLEKDPEERYQTIREVAIDLRALRKSAVSGERPAGAGGRRMAGIGPRAWLAGAILLGVLGALLATFTLRREPQGPVAVNASPVATIQSLVVLPLDNLSDDEEQEYFVAGMTDALTSGLGRVGRLRVVSRLSASRYKGTDKPLSRIAAELGVDFVVEGSVIRDRDRVRVTVELVRAKTDASIWSESYERDLSDVLSVQSDVSTAVAREVGVVLTPDEVAHLSSRRSVRPETFEAYLRGMYYTKKGTPEDFEKGMSFLREAVDLDPADPLAYAGLATAYVNLGHSTGNAESFRRAKAAARHAIELDEGSAEAQGVLAEVEMYHEWNWDAAERAFRRALEINPNHAETNAHYAALRMLRGQWDEAIAGMSLAQRLDPLSPAFSAWLGEVFWGVGRYHDAIEAEQKALELNPDFPRAKVILGLCFARIGRFEEGIEMSRTASERQPVWKALHGRALLLAGRRAEARALMEELTGDPGYAVSPLMLANFQAAYGDLDGAIASLERSYETRDAYTPWMGSWFDWSPLVNDPRYDALLERMNLKYFPRPTSES